MARAYSTLAPTAKTGKSLFWPGILFQTSGEAESVVIRSVCQPTVVSMSEALSCKVVLPETPGLLSISNVSVFQKLLLIEAPPVTPPAKPPPPRLPPMVKRPLE